MSLDQPTIIEKAVAAITNASPRWRLIGYLVAGLVILALVLFTFDRCSDWRFDRKQDRLKQNVNIALANIAEREKVIANLKEQQAVDAFAVNQAVREYIEAANYTDETKREVNRALGNLANAGKSNGNISVKDLEEKLRGL